MKRSFVMKKNIEEGMLLWSRVMVGSWYMSSSQNVWTILTVRSYRLRFMTEKIFVPNYSFIVALKLSINRLWLYYWYREFCTYFQTLLYLVIDKNWRHNTHWEPQRRHMKQEISFTHFHTTNGGHVTDFIYCASLDSLAFASGVREICIRFLVVAQLQ